ncbi:MAG: Gfo/Idh/MocA family oxidoreductase [Neomegalonema sp.]|nr:Gfo/Idh/MocA family oxidoreductase [Neomegalonema sp.]
MFRWGVLSTAPIARNFLLPAIAASDNGVATAIASMSAERLASAATQFGVPHAFDSYDAMLASDVVDGVYIPVPTAHHVEWSLKAVKAGKHVLCEKPIALRAQDIDQLITARDASGLVLSEAFMVTYHPQWAKVRDLIAAGTIGQLRHVQGAFTYRNLDPGSTRNQKELGGGGLRDIGVYPTVTTRFATGSEPLRLRARVERDAEFGTDRYASVHAEFADFDLNFYCSTQMAKRQRMTFHGDNGFIELETPFNTNVYGSALVHLHDTNHERSETFSFTSIDQYRLQVEAFVRATQGDANGLFTLESSKANQRVIDAAFEAGESGDWVAI